MSRCRIAANAVFAVIGGALLCLQALPAAADYADGQIQFENGSYETAIEIWRKSAWQNDDFRAQTALGQTYFEGKYARRDRIEAYVWYFLALANQSEFGRSSSAREAKYDQQEEVIRKLDRIAFSMTTSEREEARRRIVYILASRGAPGFFNLAEIYHDDDNHRYCKQFNTGTVFSASNFPRRPSPDDTGSEGRGYDLWIYCEFGTQLVSFNVFPKNNVEALAYYLLAERSGHPVAAQSVSDYEAYLRNKYRGAPIAPDKSGFDAGVTTSAFYQVKDIEPFKERIGLVDEVIESAKRYADMWQPPFERYPGGYSDESAGRFEQQLALERIGELNVSAIQEALRFLGFYKGVSDSEIGSQTEAAIAKYQASIGEKITGELTPRQTVRLIQEAADDNHAHSQTVLGTMYFQGIGVPRYYVRARTWFEQAARQRDPYALTNLAVIYRDGLGVTADYQKAASYLVEARDIFLSKGNSVNTSVIKKIDAELAQLGASKPPRHGVAICEDNSIPVAHVQQALAHLDYYTGEVDDIPGPATISAVKQYQHDRGDKSPSGVLTNAQVKQLFDEAKKK